MAAIDGIPGHPRRPQVLAWAKETSMKRIVLGLCRALIPLALIVMLSAGTTPAAGKLKIVCTTTDLASIAKAVAGEEAQVASITTGTEDPHFIQAKPSYMILAREANLWVRVGMELEVGWEPPLIDGSRNAAIRPGSSGHLDASEKVLRLEVPTTRITRAMGDVHPEGNPHYWLDPLNGRIIAEEIAKRLIKLDPARAKTYQKNLETFRRHLDEAMFGSVLTQRLGGARLWAWQVKGDLERQLTELGMLKEAGGWWAAMRPFKDQDIITFHKSWIYFCNRFGLKVVGELEPKPGVPPTGSHLKKITELIRVNHVKLIVQEPFYPVKAADFLASQTKVKVVVVANSVGGDPLAKDYISLMNLIVNRIAKALR
jgi:zinc/manganese transport system substrate-binding protein